MGQAAEITIDPNELRKKMQESIKRNKERQEICEACPNHRKKVTPTPPRYDEVYHKGVEWLNSL